MRPSHPILVLLLVGGIIACGIGVVEFRKARSQRAGMLGALRSGLERALDLAISNAPEESLPKMVIVAPNDLREVLLDADHRLVLLPSFLTAQTVFVPSGEIAIPGEELLCVAQLGNGKLFGITANRKFRGVDRREFGSWPHQLLWTNPSALRRVSPDN